jgi:hypothetical protein
MLAEIFTYLTTPCPRYVRRMGYLYEAIAMRERHRRHRADWRPHIANTRRCVLSMAGKCRNRDRIVVLGAGLLLDVPLNELASIFREVVLVDIVFLAQARRRINSYGNVKLLQRDVTGIAEPLFQNIQHGRQTLPSDNTPIYPAFDADTGLVVSLNILSQLCVIPGRYALKHMPSLDEKHLSDWCRRIMASHYATIASLPCDVCLITDQGFANYNRQGQIVEIGSTIPGLTLPEPDDSWTWKIAPVGEVSRYHSKELHVGAWYIHRQKTVD